MPTMEGCDKMNEQRKAFVQKCGELLKEAKPYLTSSDLVLGKEIAESPFELYVPEGEYVLVTCENGYSYKLPVEGNSLCEIAYTIFSKMLHK